MKKSITIKNIAYISIYISLIIILSFTPQTGYIIAGPITITTIPIIITISTYHLGFKGAFSTSLAFGVFSYIVSITTVPSPLADPVLLIVPRFLLGIIVWSISLMLGKVKIWKYIILAFITVLFNTLLITTFVFIVSSYNHIFKGSLMFWITLIYVNFFIELGVAIFLSIATFPLIKHFMLVSKSDLKNKW